jgi:hypothetical protein
MDDERNDYLSVERRAHELRAMAMRDCVRALAGWLRARLTTGRRA